MHRLKADEGYEIGEPGHPVRAYLDIELVVGRRSGSVPTRSTPATVSCPRTRSRARVRAARDHASSGRRRRCWAPPATRCAPARRRARGGVPVLAGSGLADAERAAAEAAEGMGFPLFVKAAMGGGGRGNAARRGPPTSWSRRSPAHARGRGGVRRRHRLPRAGDGAAAPHRGPAPRRRRPATSCTCSSATAPCSAATRR